MFFPEDVKQLPIPTADDVQHVHVRLEHDVVDSAEFDSGSEHSDRSTEDESPDIGPRDAAAAEQGADQDVESEGDDADSLGGIMEPLSLGDDTPQDGPSSQAIPFAADPGRGMTVSWSVPATDGLASLFTGPGRAPKANKASAVHQAEDEEESQASTPRRAATPGLRSSRRAPLVLDMPMPPPPPVVTAPDADDGETKGDADVSSQATAAVPEPHGGGSTSRWANMRRMFTVGVSLKRAGQQNRQRALSGEDNEATPRRRRMSVLTTWLRNVEKAKGVEIGDRTQKLADVAEGVLEARAQIDDEIRLVSAQESAELVARIESGRG